MGAVTNLERKIRELTIAPPKGYLDGQEKARALLEDPKGPTWVLVSGGMGSGKSYWAVWEALRLHFMNVAHVLSRGGKPSEVWTLLLSPTHALMRKGLAIVLEDALAETRLGYSWNKGDGLLRFDDFGGGFYTFTMEHPERIVAVTASAAVIDEPATPKSLDAIRRVPGRLRGPGILRKVGMAGTPEDIVSRQEFYDFIASPEAQEKYGEHGTNDRRIVFLSTRGNTFVEGIERFVDQQLAVLTKQQALAYVEGQFVAFNVGRVYSAFIDRSIENGGHQIPRDHALQNPPGKGNPLFLMLDFNVNPMCGLVGFPYVAAGEEIGMRILDEIRIPATSREEGQTPIGSWCAEALDRWVRDWEGPVYVYGDATAERMNVAASRTGWDLVHDALRPVVQAKGLDYFVGVWGSNPREIDRVNTVNAAFERGAILVSERCTYLRRDLNLVGWQEGKEAQIDKSDGTITHLSDSLGYGWCQRSGVAATRNAIRLPAIAVSAVPSIGERFDW